MRGGPYDPWPVGGSGGGIVSGVARWTVDAQAALEAKRAALGGQLGGPLGPVSRVSGPIFTLPLERGQLYWHPDSGAHEVHGPVGDRYAQLGGATSFLGAPTTDVTATPDGGRYVHFQGGSIYWHADVGAFEVHGAIREKWAAVGWEQGLLGYPLTDETPTADGTGRFNHFQRGSIYWHPDLGAFEVHGAIRERWEALGWERSYLGYPISDELPAGAAGRLSRFQRGDLVFTPAFGMVEIPASVVLRAPVTTGAPVGGWIELALSSRGDFTYRGHLHNSGFPTYDFKILTGLKLPGENQALLVTKDGELEGTEAIAPDRDVDWTTSGHEVKIRERWDDIGAAVLRTTIDLTGGAPTLINVLLTAFALFGYIFLRSDPNKRSKTCVYTDQDGNEVREEVFWDQGQPEPPCNRGL